MKKKRPSITQTITNSPGAMQAGRDINITDIPEPKIHYVLKTSNHEQPDGTFATVFVLTVDSKVAVRNVYVRVDAASVVEVAFWPADISGAYMGGPQGVDEGWGYTNIPNARGPLEIFVKTKKPEQCKLTYRLDP